MCYNIFINQILNRSSNMATKTESRLICEIAFDIKSSWKKPYFGAVPYLNAMLSLNTVDDMYGADCAKSIILYFLSNASSFRGLEAKALKSELKNLLK